jgi:PEP-CTERM/exosortase A-associated glycosyltransferase
MKVLHVLDHSLPLHSGYVFRTQGIVVEQRALGITTFHVTGGKHTPSDAEAEVVDGFEFHRTSLLPSTVDRLPGVDQLRVVTSLRGRLEDLIDDLRPDILHAHSPCLNGLAAMSVARRHGIPLVYELRASWEDAAVSHGSTREGSLRYRFSRALETRVMRSADHLVTICRGLRNDAVDRGVPAERITVVPNAVDRSFLGEATVSDPFRDLHQSLSNGPVVGFFGSFYRYEGLDMLLDAMKEVIEHHPRTRLLLLGSGPQDAALRTQAAVLGLDRHVIFVGRVPHDDLPAFYRAVDIFVFPRKPMRLTEIVTPLKPLEAMAAGALVVASDVGGHRELIIDGETGLLFRAGETAELVSTLSRVLDAPSAFKGLRETAQRRVLAERTWPVVARDYLSVYEKLSQ